MHNRFAEGFVEADSTNLMLDPLAARILDRGWYEADLETIRRRADEARGEAIAEAVAETGRVLRHLFWSPLRAVAAAFVEWRRRERAAAELAALDDHALADLGLRRGDIPFIIANGAPERDPHGRAAPVAANSNIEQRGAA
jgi:uncharacterized protein YjiS (DUF1127 family)